MNKSMRTENRSNWRNMEKHALNQCRQHYPKSMTMRRITLFPNPCSLFCSIFPAPCTVFPILCSLYRVPYSLLPVRCTDLPWRSHTRAAPGR